MNINGLQCIEVWPVIPETGRIGKLIGTIAAALVAVTLSANFCCFNGHYHEAGDPMTLAICWARTI